MNLYRVLLFVGLLLFDQFSKILAMFVLKPHGPVILWNRVFELYYLENRGAAFGMMENRQWIFILFALLITFGVLYYCRKLPDRRHYLPLRYCLIVLLAGAIGNLIDRIIHGFVIDYFYIRLIDFPVFNIADIYVCLSSITLIYLILFFYKDEDLFTRFDS